MVTTEEIDEALEVLGDWSEKAHATKDTEQYKKVEKNQKYFSS